MYQRQLSMFVNKQQLKLWSKRAHHTMHWPCIRGLALAALAGVRLTANNMKISAARVNSQDS